MLELPNMDFQNTQLFMVFTALSDKRDSYELFTVSIEVSIKAGDDKTSLIAYRFHHFLESFSSR